MPLTEEEIEDMKKLAIKENKLLLDENWYMRCPFLNFQNKCDIYENRPTICREYDCYKFENKTYSNKMIENVKNNKYKIVDIRKEIFEKK